MTDGSRESAVRGWGVILLPLLALLLAFQWLIHPWITDPDAFYHLGHAALYAESGPFLSTFPWTAWSVIGEVGADLWYGLHLLVLPFAGTDDPATGIRIAAVVLGLAGVGTIGAVARAHRWPVPALWPLLFLLAVPNVLYRYLSVRPEMLSIPLVIVVLSAVARGRAVVAGVAAGVAAWVHLSMWWLTVGAVATVVVVGAVERWRARGAAGEEGAGPTGAAADGAPLGRVVAAVALGIAAGALLRPAAPGAVGLAWTQIAELLFEKAGGSALTFATELSPIGPAEFLQMAWPLLVAWLVAVAAGARAMGGWARTPRVLFLASTLLAAGFLLLTFGVARRSLVYWAAFAIPGVATVLAELRSERGRRIVPRLLLAALIPLFAWSLVRNDLNARYVAIRPDRLADAAEFLRDAAEPDDLVFNTHWDAFGPLFARNRTTRYVGGMDPIFQYRFDARRYWLFHHLSTGAGAAVTCPAPTCSADETVDVWDAVRGEFGARWVLAETARDGRLIATLDSDPRFRRAFDGRDAVVFEVAVATGPVPPAPVPAISPSGDGPA